MLHEARYFQICKKTQVIYFSQRYCGVFWPVLRSQAQDSCSGSRGFDPAHDSHLQPFNICRGVGVRACVCFQTQEKILLAAVVYEGFIKYSEPMQVVATLLKILKILIFKMMIY